MSDIGDRRLVDLHESDLAQLIEDRVTAALAARDRDRAAELLDSLQAGRLLGLVPRMPPCPLEPDLAAAWQREHDTKVRQSVWARLDRARKGKGDLRLLGTLADVPGVWFVRQRLEDYIASLSKPAPPRGELRPVRR